MRAMPHALLVALSLALGTGAIEPPASGAPASGGPPAAQPTPAPTPADAPTASPAAAPVVPAAAPVVPAAEKPEAQEPETQRPEAQPTKSQDAEPQDTEPAPSTDAPASPARATTPPTPLDPTILPPEVPTRAFIVVDRFTNAAGTIERDSDREIALKDDRGRVLVFQKDRVLAIRYLLDGPAGRRVSVRLVDGRTLIGPLVEDRFDGVVLKIADIDTTFPREQLVEVRPYPTDEEFYERFRRTIEPDQYEARFSLGLWLYQRKMYAESKDELERLLDDTNHYEARQLLHEVKTHMALLASREGATAPTRPVDGGAPRYRTPSNLLSNADVNLIRVYELDLARPPRMQIPQSLIASMIEKYGDSPLIPARSAERTAFFSKDPAEIVKVLFALKARELYGEVEVLGEPESLNLFHRRVHNAWIINNCATSRCHGGKYAGRLFLHNRNYKDENVRATNLLILLRTSIDGRPLVDPDQPTDSLVYQYALPRTEARRPHPEVRGWTPVFNAGRRGLQEDFVRWVRSMRRPTGDYPVEYTPPALLLPEAPPVGGPDR